MKKLRHTAADDAVNGYTQGKEYLVENEHYESIAVRNDDGELHFYTIEPDSAGESFRTWFEVVE